MSNLCLNEICFISEKGNELLDFYSKLKAIYETRRKFKACSLSLIEVAKGFGLSTRIYQSRNFILEIGDIKDNSNLQTKYFSIITETAHVPQNDLWDSIISYYPSISYVYAVEECSCGLFINSDSNREYLTYEYKLTIYYDEIGEDLNKYFNSNLCLSNEDLYFSNDEDVISHMIYITGKDFDNIDAVSKYLDEISSRNPDAYIALNRFRDS